MAKQSVAKKAAEEKRKAERNNLIERQMDNKLVLYSVFILLGVLLLGGFYYFTKGTFDITKLVGATIDCGDKLNNPTIALDSVVENGSKINITVKASDDCGIEKVERREYLYKVVDGKNVDDIILGNENDGNFETAFTNTYIFDKNNYGLTGGKLKIEFKVIDASGKISSTATKLFDL